MSEAATPLPIQPFHREKTEHRAAFRPHKDPREKRGGYMYKRQNEGLIVIDLKLNARFTSPVTMLAHPQHLTEK